MIKHSAGIPSPSCKRRIIESVSGGNATVIAQYEHPGALQSGSQGDVESLPNGNIFIGWGSEPYFSEFSSAGTLLYDAHFHGSYQAYRAYRFTWTGAPTGPPTAVLASSGSHRSVYVSWNGDTRTATWRLLAGSSAKTLAPLATALRTGFETALSPPAAASFYAVQALDVNGAVIGTSATIHG